MDKLQVLVTAANGHTGYPAAKELLRLGFKVKAMIRNPHNPKAVDLQRSGADLFIGDMNDVRDYRKALKGVQRAYFCAPLGRNTLFQTVAFMTAAQESRLEHVVHMSQWLLSAAHPAMNTKEQWLSDQVVKMNPDIGHTFINTGLFGFTNFMALDSIVHLGIMPTTVRGASQSYAVGLNASPSDTDQGHVIAHILKDPTPHIGKTYRITGPKLVSPKEIAETFSTLLQKRVKLMEVSEAMLLKSLKSNGIGTLYEMHNIIHYLRELEKGTFEIQGVTNVVKSITGREPEDFATMARNAIEQMPRSQPTLGNKLLAAGAFFKSMLVRKPNLAQFEKEQELPQFMHGMQYAIESEAWSKKRQGAHFEFADQPSTLVLPRQAG